ncbi:MAG: hypothetical protein V3T75_05635 [candidate division Zixibacteria bacterium]
MLTKSSLPDSVGVDFTKGRWNHGSTPENTASGLCPLTMTIMDGPPRRVTVCPYFRGRQMPSSAPLK